MPILYEYLGIIIKFYSNEHEPIHIHAIKGNKIIIVKFYIKNETITKTIYDENIGKYSPNELNNLKRFIERYKYSIVTLWKQYFEQHLPIQPVKLTKKI